MRLFPVGVGARRRLTCLDALAEACLVDHGLTNSVHRLLSIAEGRIPVAMKGHVPMISAAGLSSGPASSRASYAVRVKSMIQFVSHAAPPSAEKACSQRQEFSLMPLQMKRLRTH